MARDALDSITTEIQYTEVFRRLIPIPLLQFSHLDESLGAEIISETNFNFGSNLKNWFDFFDRNHNGEISFEEFTLALNRLNTQLSTEDMSTLFLRFQTNKADELIDWTEFMTFFETVIHRKYVERITIDLTDDDVDMIKILKQFVIKCSLPLPEVSTTTTTVNNNKNNNNKNSEGNQENKNKTVPPKKILYQEILTLNKNDIIRNAELITRSGLHITEQAMDRICRIFNYDLATFQKFYLTVVGSPDSLDTIINDTLCQLLLALSSRCHVAASPPPPTTTTTTTTVSNNSSQSGNNSGSKMNDNDSNNKNNNNIDFSIFNMTSDDELSKLWLSVSPTRETLVSYEQFSNYLCEVFSQHLDLEKNPVNQKSKDKNISPSTNNAQGNGNLLFRSLERNVLCNLICDEIVHSCWNKLSQQERNGRLVKTHTNKLSYSAFKAFFRRSHINTIEQKLQYLVYLQNCADTGTINYLVHIFIPTLQYGPLRDESQLNHIILLAYDPLSSTIYKMKVLIILLCYYFVIIFFFVLFIVLLDFNQSMLIELNFVD